MGEVSKSLGRSIIFLAFKPIGMPSLGYLKVGLLHLMLVGILLDSQCLVIVLLNRRNGSGVLD